MAGTFGISTRFFLLRSGTWTKTATSVWLLRAGEFTGELRRSLGVVLEKFGENSDIRVQSPRSRESGSAHCSRSGFSSDTTFIGFDEGVLEIDKDYRLVKLGNSNEMSDIAGKQGIWDS